MFLSVFPPSLHGVHCILVFFITGLYQPGISRISRMGEGTDSDAFLPLHNKGCVTMWPCHFYILKKYLKAKEEELWKLKYFTIHANIYNLQKILFKKKFKNPSRYYNLSFLCYFMNLKFQHKLKKISFFQKASYKKKKDLLLLPKGQNPLSYYTLQ